MSKVKFLLGKSSNLPKSGRRGAFYLTNDTNSFYFCDGGGPPKLVGTTYSLEKSDNTITLKGGDGSKSEIILNLDHSSPTSKFGLGTTNNYGHVKISNENCSTMTHSNGVVAGVCHTHNYAGSSSEGGPAISANQLSSDVTIGSYNHPVYFNKGKPFQVSFYLSTSVESVQEIEGSIGYPPSTIEGYPSSILSNYMIYLPEGVVPIKLNSVIVEPLRGYIKVNSSSFGFSAAGPYAGRWHALINGYCSVVANDNHSYDYDCKCTVKFKGSFLRI